MAIATKELAGKADGKAISQKVRSLLQCAKTNFWGKRRGETGGAFLFLLLLAIINTQDSFWANQYCFIESLIDIHFLLLSVT